MVCWLSSFGSTWLAPAEQINKAQFWPCLGVICKPELQSYTWLLALFPLGLFRCSAVLPWWLFSTMTLPHSVPDLQPAIHRLKLQKSRVKRSSFFQLRLLSCIYVLRKLILISRRKQVIWLFSHLAPLKKKWQKQILMGTRFNHSHILTRQRSIVSTSKSALVLFPFHSEKNLGSTPVLTFLEGLSSSLAHYPCQLFI